MLSPIVRLVDDEEQLTQAQAFVLRLAGIDSVRYPSAEDFLERDSPARPGCVVLDIRMGGMSGLQCQDELLQRGNPLPVLFLSGHGDIDMAMMAIKKGAADFLQKPVPAERLVEACRTLIDWDIRQRGAAEERRLAAERLATLTPRELEVARLVATGIANKTAAQQLGVSEQGVKLHRSNIYRKLGVRSALEIRDMLERSAERGEAGQGLLTVRMLPRR